jgi:hypothetical protein
LFKIILKVLIDFSISLLMVALKLFSVTMHSLLESIRCSQFKAAKIFNLYNHTFL